MAALTLVAPYKRFVWVMAVTLASANIMLLFIDKTVFFMFKFHLNNTLLQMVTSNESYGLFDFSAHELYLLIGFGCIVLFFEIFTAYCVWTKLVVEKPYRFPAWVIPLWFFAFLLSYFSLIFSISKANNLISQQTPNLPLYNQIMSQLIPEKDAEKVLYQYSEVHFSEPIFANTPMQYPLHPLRCTKPQNPPNIILIMVDSLRFDSLRKDYMPNLVQFSEKSWQFQKHLSGGNCTMPGLFSLFYSLPLNYWTAAMEQKIPPLFMQLLQKYHYVFKIFWSGPLHNPPFDKTLFSGLGDMDQNEESGLDVGDNDRRITKDAIQFLQSDNANQPFFLNLFYDAPHGYCRNQSYPQLYKPAIKDCLRVGLTNRTNPIPYLNRYHNAVHFVDSELGNLLAAIEKSGHLEDSVVIITSDHGQEFNDNKQNFWEHTGNFTNVQVQVPLIIHWPKEAARYINYQTSSYDVAPTLLQNIFQCKNPTMDLGIGQNLLKSDQRLPFILSASYTNIGLIETDRLTTLRASGPIDITDKQAKPEPYATPRMETIKKALQLMRMYYVK